MRVVICGGAKTENIVKATRDNFKSSGVDFLTVKYIDTVADLFNRGEYFDRIILVEPGWTRDGIITSETQIRHTLSEFANQMIDQNTNPKSEYVFLSQTQEMAGIVNEEILLIKSQSELAVKAPPYKVNLFKALVLAELGRFPEQLAYKSTEVISDDRGDNFTEEIPPEPDQFTPEDIIPGSVRNANNLDYNSGMDPNDFDQWFNENGQGAPVGETQQPDQGQTPNIDWDMSKGGEQPPYNPDMPQDGFGTDFPDDPFGGIPEADWDAPEQPQTIQHQEQPQENWEPSQDNWEPSQNNWQEPIPEEQSQGAPQDWAPQEPGSSDWNPKADWPEEQPVEPPVEQPISGDDYSQPDGDPNNWSPQEDWPDAPQEPQQSWENPTDQTFEPQPSETGFTPPDNIGNIPDYSGPDSGYKGIPTEEIPQDEPVYPGQSTDYNDPSMGMPQDAQADWNNDYGDYGQSQEQPVYPEYNGNQPYIDPPVTVDDDDYRGQAGYQQTNDTAEPDEPEAEHKVKRPDNRDLRAAFQAFASRGNSIVVTGCSGSGTSTVAMNLANIICNMGYTVLLVDLDTVNKAQSYISKEHYDAVEVDGASIMAAVNSNSGINAYISIIRQGFHLLTMGMASDSKKPEEAFKKDKLARFINMAKSSHNFVIYDVPFDAATHHLDQVIYTADNIILTIDYSNWGVSKTLLAMCNIGSDDMEETLFSRSQIIFNRYRPIKRILGKRLKKPTDVTDIMDTKLIELIGEDPGYAFSNLHICGSIPYDPNFENGWFAEEQYSDTKKGNDLFVQLLKNIVLHT